jgi:hypothetical protein
MSEWKLGPEVAGTEFSPHDFSWTWPDSQLIARAAGCSIDDPLDRPSLLRDSTRPGHPMIAFNGALLARNREEVMRTLCGGYERWQQVGRWGAAFLRFAAGLPRSGRGRVSCRFTEVGGTSKGHALARFAFEVDDAATGARLADGWMLLFLLGCGSEALGRLASPRIEIPERTPDFVVSHETPANVTFDWAMPSDDWNATHFEIRPGNPAPLVHGPRNLAMVLHDAARLLAGGGPERVREITLGSLAAPHYPREATETRLWKAGDRLLLARLVVPAPARLDGGAGEKVVIDQIEIALTDPPV